MLRPMIRSSPAALRRVSSRLPQTSRRFVSSSPADRPRTWKSSALRWGAAVAAVYWYNTSPIFADEPATQTIPPPPTFSVDDQQTVDAIIEEKRRKAAPKIAERVPMPETTQDPAESAPSVARDAADATTYPAEGGVGALEEEADQQGAFNPETGEINWDCPCLGGMANGPCGEDFKAAFSCFVFSTEEPKGMDCIEKFQGMQDCFRKYPEIYGAELAEDGADEDQPAIDSSAAVPAAEPEDESSGAMTVPSDAESSTLAAKAQTDQSSLAPKTKEQTETFQSTESVAKPAAQIPGSNQAS